MHSRIIQEDIADSTRGRELVETKVRLARVALLSSIDRISLISNSTDAPVILMCAILMCTDAHTRQTLISYVRWLSWRRACHRNCPGCILESVGIIFLFPIRYIGSMHFICNIHMVLHLKFGLCNRNDNEKKCILK